MAEPSRILVLFGSVVLQGAERGNLEALATLKGQGAEFLCLIADDWWNTIVPPVLDERGFAWRKVPYVHIGKGLSWYTVLWDNPYRFVQANMAFLRAVREFQPTHVHTYAQFHIANFFWGLIRVRTPLVFRAGDVPTLHNWFWRLSWRFAVWRTTRFTAISQFVARSLRASDVKAEKITVIYSRAPARLARQRAAIELQLPATARVVAFIGQISEHKGPHVLVNAFRELAADYPQAYLVLAGRISDWEGDAWARALRDATKADPLVGDRITFLGEIEDVPGLLARCEVLVVPSLCEEGLGNVVMEAKQAGKAVIVFPRGGLPEMIEHGVDGLVCRDATKLALVEALRVYLENPALACEHGAATAVTTERFDHAHFDANWCEVYANASRDARYDAAVAP